MTHPQTHSPAPATELEVILDRQSSLLAEIESLDRRRRAAIAGADMEALESLLAARERAVGELGRLAPDIDRLRGACPEDARIRGRLAQAAAVFERIAANDEADLAELGRRRADLAGTMASLSQRRTAAGAYAVPASSASLYQDRHA